MPPSEDSAPQELNPPASARATRLFARALSRRSSQFSPPRQASMGALGSLGRAADALGESLVARADFARGFDRSEWLSALLSRYRIGAWASDTPSLHYLRWLRGVPGPSPEAYFGGFWQPSPGLPAAYPQAHGQIFRDQGAVPFPMADPVFARRAGDQSAFAEAPPAGPSLTRRGLPPRTPLLPSTLSTVPLSVSQALPLVLTLHRFTAQAGLADRPAPPPLRSAFPERMAEAVVRRAEPTTRRGIGPAPEREQAELPMALSYPPVPLASWLGVAASAPEHVEPESAPGFTRTVFSPAASHLLVLPPLPAEPPARPMSEHPSQMAFAALPKMTSSPASRDAALAASEAFLTTRNAATQPVRPSLERRSPAAPVGMRVAPPIVSDAGSTEVETPSGGDEAHPAARKSPLCAAASAVALVERLGTTGFPQGNLIGQYEPAGQQAAAFVRRLALPSFGGAGLPHPPAASRPGPDGEVRPLILARESFVPLLTLPRLRRPDAFPDNALTAGGISPLNFLHESKGAGTRKAEAPAPLRVGTPFHVGAGEPRPYARDLSEFGAPTLSLPRVAQHRRDFSTALPGGQDERRYEATPDLTPSVPAGRTGGLLVGVSHTTIPGDAPHSAGLPRRRVPRHSDLDQDGGLARNTTPGDRRVGFVGSLLARVQPPVEPSRLLGVEAAVPGNVPGTPSAPAAFDAFAPSLEFLLPRQRRSGVARGQGLLETSAMSAPVLPSSALTGMLAAARSVPAQVPFVTRRLGTDRPHTLSAGEVLKASGVRRAVGPSLTQHPIGRDTLKTGNASAPKPPGQEPGLRPSVLGRTPVGVVRSGPVSSVTVPFSPRFAPSASVGSVARPTLRLPLRGLPPRAADREMTSGVAGQTYPGPAERRGPGSAPSGGFPGLGGLRLQPQTFPQQPFSQISPQQAAEDIAATNGQARSGSPQLRGRGVGIVGRLLDLDGLRLRSQVFPQTHLQQGAGQATGDVVTLLRPSSAPDRDRRPGVLGSLLSRLPSFIDLGPVIAGAAVPRESRGAKPDVSDALLPVPDLTLPRVRGAVSNEVADSSVPEDGRPSFAPVARQREAFVSRLLSRVLPVILGREPIPSSLPRPQSTGAVSIASSLFAGVTSSALLPPPAPYPQRLRAPLPGIAAGRLDEAVLGHVPFEGARTGTPLSQVAPTPLNLAPMARAARTETRRAERPATWSAAASLSPARALTGMLADAHSVLADAHSVLADAHSVLVRVPLLARLLGTDGAGAAGADVLLAYPGVRQAGGPTLAQRRPRQDTLQAEARAEKVERATLTANIPPERQASSSVATSLLSRYPTAIGDVDTADGVMSGRLWRGDPVVAASHAISHRPSASLPFPVLSALRPRGRREDADAPDAATTVTRPVWAAPHLRPFEVAEGMSRPVATPLGLGRFRGKAGEDTVAGAQSFLPPSAGVTPVPEFLRRWTQTPAFFAAGAFGVGDRLALPGRVAGNRAGHSRLSDGFPFEERSAPAAWGYPSARRSGLAGVESLGTVRQSGRVQEVGGAFDEGAFSAAVGGAVAESLQAQLLSPIREFLKATLARLPFTAGRSAPEPSTGVAGTEAGGLPFRPLAAADLWPSLLPREEEIAGQTPWEPAYPVPNMSSVTLLQPPIGPTADPLFEPRRQGQTLTGAAALLQGAGDSPAAAFLPRLLRQALSGEAGPAASIGVRRAAPTFGTAPAVPRAAQMSLPRQVGGTPQGSGEAGGTESASMLAALGANRSLDALLARSSRLGPRSPDAPRLTLPGHWPEEHGAHAGGIADFPSFPRTGVAPKVDGGAEAQRRGWRSAGAPAGRAPEMPLPVRTAPADGQPTATFRDPLLIQRATSGSAAAQAQNTGAASQTDSDGESSGGDGPDVNTLAKEVWSQLRRRLANEAARAGQR